MKKVLLSMVALFMVISLSACPKEGYSHDRSLTIKVKSRLARDHEIKARKINVEVRDGVVILIGTVSTQREIDRAILIVRDVPGVVKVHSELTVDMGDDDGHRKGKTVLSDSKITTKVKKQFARDAQISLSAINVKTRDGVVELTGSVRSQAEKNRAAMLAQSVKGVKGVINNLYIIEKRDRSDDDDDGHKGKGKDKAKDKVKDDDRGKHKGWKQPPPAKTDTGHKQPPGQAKDKDKNKDKGKHKGWEQPPPAKTDAGTQKPKNVDSRIANDVAAELRGAKGFDAKSISITCKGGVITLEGTVQSKNDKARATKLAAKVKGVVKVVNKLKVEQAKTKDKGKTFKREKKSDMKSKPFRKY